METFAKLSGTAIICSDSQSAKLDFPIDSRLRGNDGRFCKGLLDGRGIKGEGDNKTTPTAKIPSPLMGESQSLSQCLTLGAEGENKTVPPPCHSEQSEESKISDHNHPGPSYWTVPVIPAQAGIYRVDVSWPSFPRRRESTGWQGDAGETSQTNRPYPLSLDGRGIKGEGDQVQNNLRTAIHRIHITKT